MTPSSTRRRVVCLLLVCAGVVSACGKKGPPLPPLARVPAAPTGLQAARIGNDLSPFLVPAANVSGQAPADLGSLDLYGYTGMAPPAGPDLTKAAVKIASYPVQPVLPPMPVPEEGAPPPPPPPPLPPGFVQGSPAVVREALTPESRALTMEPLPEVAPVADESPAVAGAVVAPSDTGALKRYYFVVAVSPRGRQSVATSLVSVPLDDASGAPGAPQATYTATRMTLSWTAPDNARVPEPPASVPGLLPSRPLVAAVAPTLLHVFDVPATPPAVVDPFALAVPATLSPKPIAGTAFAIDGPVGFGVQKCFVVRAVDQVAGAPVIGPASPPGCVTPVDSFPPAAPQQLVAVSGVGVITLLWDPNTEPDLAGYIVLRGLAPGDTLQALTPTPIRDAQYQDRTATPGVRYVYAVVAVDTATPQNVSGQSNRVEEAAR